MLDGVVPFPPEFAKKYREKGYWLDKSLAQEFEPIFANYAGRIAFWDADRSYTYKEIDQISDRLALNLLDLGQCGANRLGLAVEITAHVALQHLQIGTGAVQLARNQA